VRAVLRAVLRVVRAVLRGVVFLVAVLFPDFLVAIVSLRFCFDVATCPFSRARRPKMSLSLELSKNDAAAKIDLWQPRRLDVAAGGDILQYAGADSSSLFTSR
jgi:hypothetical protein